MSEIKRISNLELQDIANRFKNNAPAVDYWSLRLEDHRYEGICVRQAVLEPLQTQLSRGALITVAHGGGIGYAATNDVSSSGLREASKQAMAWAKNMTISLRRQRRQENRLSQTAVCLKKRFRLSAAH